MKAVIYARFSTANQNDSSIADQVRICSEYASRQGLEIVATFEDQGISGAAMGNRPGAQRALAALQEGMTLLVADLSRLSRSQDLAPLVTRLSHRRARVIGVQDGYDSTSRTARMQAGLSGIMSEEFRSMIKDRTYTALESRARNKRPTGGKCYGYRANAVDKGEAFMVREIFGKYADGQSCQAIAADFNARRIPSPGASWANRIERRASGWMGSAIRSMLRNERYCGVIRWNQSEWIKDPDTGKRIRRERPRSEWLEYSDESLRIVSQELWLRVQRRIDGLSAHKNWGVQRGKAKYILSGLLRCESCDSHYVICNKHEYACSGYVNGRACENGIRVRRDHLENVLISPLRTDLLAPASVAGMATQLRSGFMAALKAREASAATAPQEILELRSRISRLRGRLAAGDADMAPDEIQAAIDRAEAKLADMSAERPESKQSAKVLAMLPKAAEEIRREIGSALAGDPRSAARVRGTLRGLFSGRISMEPGADGSLWASYGLQPAALLAIGNRGSGGRI
jgi:site-specific DNA recombinase